MRIQVSMHMGQFAQDGKCAHFVSLCLISESNLLKFLKTPPFRPSSAIFEVRIEPPCVYTVTARPESTCLSFRPSNFDDFPFF